VGGAAGIGREANRRVKMGRVNWVKHKGKRILHVDHSTLSEEEHQAVIGLAIDAMIELPEGSELLDIADFTGTPVTQSKRRKLKELAIVRQRLTGATVVVGLSGFGKAMAGLLNPGMKYLDSLEEAKEWLVQQTER
jgi:hypothetical protein